MSSTPVTKPQQPRRRARRQSHAHHAAVRPSDRRRAAGPVCPRGPGGPRPRPGSHPVLRADIQFYALTVYPRIIRSTFGISLDQRATQAPLASGIDMFLSYYQAKGPAQSANTGLPRGSQASQETP
jgi:hypothetical protein